MMKKLLFLFLVIVFTASSSILMAQQRSSQIGSEKHREIIKNFKPIEQVDPGTRDTRALSLVYSENFDGNGAAFPPGWSVDGSSASCVWAVDSMPNPPGYNSPPYSLNYNNGVDYDCGYNWGYATSPLITVWGSDFDVQFMMNNNGEDFPGFDETYLIVYDELGNSIYVELLDPAVDGVWGAQSFTIPNPDNHQRVYIEFYFDTGDAFVNDYAGPFIDDLMVYADLPPVPVSNWAIILGVLLIGTFIVVRYRRSLA